MPVTVALGACGPGPREAGRADSAASAGLPGGDSSRHDTAAAPRPAAPVGDGPRDDTIHHGEEETMPDTTGPAAPIQEVLERHRDAWMARPEVTGLGIGRCEGRPCLVVYLLRRTEEIEAFLPDTVQGHPVRLEVTGRVEPRDGRGGGSGEDAGA